MKKNRIIYLCVIVALLLTNCKSFNQNKLHFIDYLMKSDEFYYSLQENSNKITIYDQNKELVKIDREFNKNDVFINFTVDKPLISDYFTVNKVIIDQNLAFIALRNSSGRKNYVYYLIKNNKHHTWHITNVQINNTL